MDYETARALKIALEAFMRSLDAPMRLAAEADDPKFRRMMGALASDLVAKVDHELFPYLDALHPGLKSIDP